MRNINKNYHSKFSCRNSKFLNGKSVRFDIAYEHLFHFHHYRNRLINSSMFKMANII